MFVILTNILFRFLTNSKNTIVAKGLEHKQKLIYSGGFIVMVAICN